MCMFTFYVDLLRGLFKTVRNELQNVCYAPILFQPRTNFVLYTLLDVYLHIPTLRFIVYNQQVCFFGLSEIATQFPSLVEHGIRSLL